VTQNPNNPPDPDAGPPPSGPRRRRWGARSQRDSEPTAREPDRGLGREPDRRYGAGGEAGRGPGGEAGRGPGREPGEEYDEGAEYEYGEPGEPYGPDTGVRATFLPGLEAVSILALITGLLGAGAYLLINPLVQAHDAARTWSDFKNNVPRNKQDPFGLQRDYVGFQSWTHIILGLVAVLLALLVLGMWTARAHSLHSRAIAQAALVLGLAVVLYGILLKTGAVGSEIPSMSEISNALSTAQ